MSPRVPREINFVLINIAPCRVIISMFHVKSKRNIYLSFIYIILTLLLLRENKDIFSNTYTTLLIFDILRNKIFVNL